MIKKLSRDDVFNSALSIGVLSIIGSVLTISAENFLLSPIDNEVAISKAHIQAQTEIQKAQIRAQADLAKVQKQNELLIDSPAETPSFQWAQASPTDQTIVGCFINGAYFPLESGSCHQPQG